MALGTYFLDGIGSSYVKPILGSRPRDVPLRRGVAYSDPNAQYNLARLYLEGTGVAADARHAARWFNLAAEKGHHQAQALLGHLLSTGDGVPRQRGLGLMWLTIARECADPGKDRWIYDLYDKAFAGANERDRQMALANLEQFLKRKR